MTRSEMINKLNKKLNYKRFEHSIGVEYTAASLAFIYGVDVESARIAGLLHDCAKYHTHDEYLKKANKYELEINKWEMQNPDLLHAKLGAIYAKEKYLVINEEILQGIQFHTTGKPRMTMLEKIIYVSDYIEPNRKFIDDIDIIRKEAFYDIDKCILHILEDTVNYLDAGNNIDPITFEALEYYKKLI